MRETHRFETLVNYFTSPQEFQIEFMVACMQFINIVVHSVEVIFRSIEWFPLKIPLFFILRI